MQRTLAFLLLLLVITPLAAPRPAHAGEVQLSIGLAGAGTDWKNDATGGGTLRLGYRFIDLVGIYFIGRLGYGSVDDRLLTSLQVGAQIWGRLGSVRPYARLGLLHNHEEPWAAVVNQPAGAVLGVGDGIRHRTGLEAGLGLDFPFFKRAKWEIVGGIEATAAWLTYSTGPAWYWGGGFLFGFNYTI